MQLRPTQQEVLKLITDAISAGKQDIFIQAPTGTGKSLIALELSKTLGDAGYTSYLLTSEKSLQQQYENDCHAKFADRHDEVVSIAGVDSYCCDLNGEKFSLGVCRSLGMSYGAAQQLPCAASCQYMKRWMSARFSRRTIMNYSYYLIQMNYVYRKMGNEAPFQPRDITICDEAHKLPDVIENHFACRLNPEITDRIVSVVEGLRAIGHAYDVSTYRLHHSIQDALRVPDQADPSLHLTALQTVRDEYLHVLGQLTEIKTDLTSKHVPKGHSTTQLTSWHKVLPRQIKWFFSLCDSVKDHHCKIEDYTEMIEEHGLDHLVVCSDDGARSYHNTSDFHLFHRHLKPFSRVRIYMSATLQPKLLIGRWKLDPSSCQIINVSSDWDAAASPVILCGKTNLGYAGGPSATAAAVQEIDDILDVHANERGIIHTVTHLISEQLKQNSRHARRMLVYSNTAEKLELLQNLKDYPQNSILVGPSLFTGIDLPDDLGRFNIITKLAFPNVGNALWKRRFDCDKEIYFGETAAVLEQSAGRATRHKDDYSTTYIIDSRAVDFVKYSERFLSAAFLERLTMPQVR